MLPSLRPLRSLFQWPSQRAPLSPHIIEWLILLISLLLHHLYYHPKKGALLCSLPSGQCLAGAYHVMDLGGCIGEIRPWHTCSVKGQIGNILGFVGHMVSVATTQLCCSRQSVDSKQTSEHGCGLVHFH